MEFINDDGNLEIEGGELIFRNFAGREERFNPAGKRNFCVYLDNQDLAQDLSEMNWNVKIRMPRDEGGTPRYYIPVAVNYEAKYPPIICLISNGKKTEPLDEESVSILDYPTSIVEAYLVIHPSYWTRESDGSRRVKAYLQEGYFAIRRSRFAEKYAAEEYPEE